LRDHGSNSSAPRRSTRISSPCPPASCLLPSACCELFSAPLRLHAIPTCCGDRQEVKLSIHEFKPFAATRCPVSYLTWSFVMASIPPDPQHESQTVRTASRLRILTSSPASGRSTIMWATSRGLKSSYGPTGHLPHDGRRVTLPHLSALGRGVVLQLFAVAAAACMWGGRGWRSIPAPRHLSPIAFPARCGEV